MGVAMSFSTLKCQVCGKARAPEGEMCPYCGATVRSVYGRGMPPPYSVVAEGREKRRAIELRHGKRVRRRSRNNALVGALVFALCSWGLVGTVLGNLVLRDIIETQAGREGRGDPRTRTEDGVPQGPSVGAVIMGMLLVLPLSAVLGAPAGYVISRREGGSDLGTALGAGAYGLIAVLVNLPSILTTGHPMLEVLLCAFLGLMLGATAGRVLGSHVQSEGE